MTRGDTVEIRVKKLWTIFFSLLLIVIGIAPVYFIDFNNILPEDIFQLPIAVFFFYLSYRYGIKRLLIGPIVTLTKYSITIRDENAAHTYDWATIKKIKVEVVTEKNVEGKDISRTLLTVWTTVMNASDEFNISDLKMNSDEIRELINSYTEGTSVNKMHKQWLDSV